MKLNTNEMTFTLEFDNGDTAQITFNPYDKQFHQRIEKFSENLDKYAKEFNTEKYKSKLGELSINPAMITIDNLIDLPPADIQALYKQVEVFNEIETEFNNKIKTEIDIVFDRNISKTVFKYCEPATLVEYVDKNGNKRNEMFVLQFFYWFAEELNAQGIKNSEAMAKYINKYK